MTGTASPTTATRTLRAERQHHATAGSAGSRLAAGVSSLPRAGDGGERRAKDCGHVPEDNEGDGDIFEIVVHGGLLWLAPSRPICLGGNVVSNDAALVASEQ